jgi:hypothetical protein
MSLAARMITPADVKTAKGFVAQLNEMKSREGARRAGSAETARTRDVLHAVVELYYDRFATAVDVANSATVSGARGFPACEWCCVNGQRAGEHDFGRESYLESPDIAYHHTAVWRGRVSIPSSRRLLFARSSEEERDHVGRVTVWHAHCNSLRPEVLR